jgi:hypothetical protein
VPKIVSLGDFKGLSVVMQKVNIGTGVAFLVFSAVYYFYLIPTQIVGGGGVGYESALLQPDYFPRIAILCFSLFSALLVYQGFRRQDNEALFDSESERPLTQVSSVVIIAAIYVLALDYFGYALTTPIFLAVMMIFYGTRNWRYVVPVALLAPIILDQFFWQSFQIILPEGVFFE